jgi:hypothetical protein
MGVPFSEVGYTSATTGRRDHEVHKRHVVALKKNILEPVAITSRCISCRTEIRNGDTQNRNRGDYDYTVFYFVVYIGTASGS